MYSALERHMTGARGCVAPFIVSEEDVCEEAEAANETYWIAWNRVTNQVHSTSTTPSSLYEYFGP